MNNISFKEYQSIISEYTNDSPCPVRNTIEIFQKKWMEIDNVIPI